MLSDKTDKENHISLQLIKLNEIIALENLRDENRCSRRSIYNL